MNLAIIGAGESSRLKADGLKTPKHLVKIGGEYLIERIIRIGRTNGIKKVYCIINSNEPELKKYLSTTDFGIPINLVVQSTESSLHSLFLLSPFLRNESFFLATTDSVFLENEFSEYYAFSSLQEDADGVLAVTRYIDDEKPLCVAMNEDDTILKFSDSKEGYNWSTGGIYFFSPRIFYEMEYALDSGISRLRNYLKHLVSRNYLLKGYSFSKIIDVDHLSDVGKAENFVRGIDL